MIVKKGGLHMKKLNYLLLILVLFSLLTGFDQRNIVVAEIETTIIKAEKILRYDVKFKNIGKKDIQSEFDYPGHHPNGFEIVIRPNEKLASLMEMESNSKYKKMMFRGGGGNGFFKAGTESQFNIEYQIKSDSDLEEVKKNALNSTLLLLDGTNVVKEIPLSPKK
jgi:hypothetical protein